MGKPDLNPFKSIQETIYLIDRNLNDGIDCTNKNYIFIGQVNKLCANFCCLKISVLVRLFKTYHCTFYGSQMWRFSSQSFNSVCTSWNKVVRRILNHHIMPMPGY